MASEKLSIPQLSLRQRFVWKRRHHSFNSKISSFFFFYQCFSLQIFFQGDATVKASTYSGIKNEYCLPRPSWSYSQLKWLKPSQSLIVASASIWNGWDRPSSLAVLIQLLTTALLDMNYYLCSDNGVVVTFSANIADTISQSQLFY